MVEADTELLRSIYLLAQQSTLLAQTDFTQSNDNELVLQLMEGVIAGFFLFIFLFSYIFLRSKHDGITLNIYVDI